MLDNIGYNEIKKRKKSYRLVTVEKGYSGRLETFGKIVCFSWLLDGVEITEEDLKLVIPLDNIMEQVSFIEGYTRANSMIKLGFNKDGYNEFLEKNINPSQKEAVELVLDIAYGRAQSNSKIK